MSYLERQNGKKQKMTNENQKSLKLKNHINIKFRIQWFLEEKYMFYHERQSIKYGKIIGVNSDGNLKILLNNNNHLYVTSSETIIYKGNKCS